MTRGVGVVVNQLSARILFYPTYARLKNMNKMTPKMGTRSQSGGDRGDCATVEGLDSAIGAKAACCSALARQRQQPSCMRTHTTQPTHVQPSTPNITSFNP